MIAVPVIYQQMMNANPAGMLLVDAQQPDLPIVFVNRAFERTTGYTLAEVVGRNPLFLQGDDLHQPGLDALQQAIAQQRAGHAVLRNYRKDGTLFWNDMHITPLLDDAGQVTHFIGVQQDVTAQRQLEATLQQCEQCYQAALSVSLDAFYMLECQRDPAGEITDFCIIEANDHAQQLFKMPRETFLGAPCRIASTACT